VSVAREVIHAYWRKPWDGRNAPAAYLSPKAAARSRFLVDLFGRHVSKATSVFEVGCNAGRNLAHLHAAGYTRLQACDISAAAVDLLRSAHPELRAPVMVGPAEDLLPTLPDRAFGAVFTMAVLEHLPPESEQVFADMVRIAGKTLVTVEDEVLPSWRHFPRKYRDIFEGLGMRQVEETSCAAVPGLGKRFMARVFVR
jgi:SAM-dependent methyltransferase